jgi:riboflavin kinase/FMN adenylyltransferase
VQLIRNMSQLTSRQRGGAVAIGNFDGVHRGHARIIERLIALSRAVSGPATVFTFDPHPVRVLRPDLAPPPLTWTDRKAELLAELGVDVVVAYPTDEALLALSPDAFFDRVVREQLAARAIVEGPNFFFGRDRSGDIERLRQLSDRHRITLEVVPPLQCGAKYISSSRIRTAVAQGDVAEARRWLTRPYRIRGLVTHGAGRGHRIGFPTANLDAIDTLLPAYGVYAGRARVEKTWRPAAVNIGPNPTFGERALKVEVHVLDFDGPLYGQPLEVDFIARLRDIQSFSSVEQLVEQLRDDIEAVRGATEQEIQEFGHEH